MDNIIYQEYGIQEPVYEHKFHKRRKWKLDIAWPVKKVAVEIEGGVWKYGRHNRASTFIKDMEKYNALAEMGWLLLRYQPGQIDYKQIKNTLDVRG